jgi:hypothetical protein
VEHVRRGDVRREPERHLPERDQIVHLERRRGHLVAVHERPVARAQIAQRDLLLVDDQLGMPPGDRRIGHREVTRRRAPDDQGRIQLESNDWVPSGLMRR